LGLFQAIIRMSNRLSHESEFKRSQEGGINSGFVSTKRLFHNIRLGKITREHVHRIDQELSLGKLREELGR
jgi:hypothetical protein